MLTYEHMYGPQGFGGFGRRDIYFHGAGEQAHGFGDLGRPVKSKNKFINLTLKERPPLCLIKNIFGFWGVGRGLPRPH